MTDESDVIFGSGLGVVLLALSPLPCTLANSESLKRILVLNLLLLSKLEFCLDVITAEAGVVVVVVGGKWLEVVLLADDLNTFLTFFTFGLLLSLAPNGLGAAVDMNRMMALLEPLLGELLVDDLINGWAVGKFGMGATVVLLAL